MSEEELITGLGGLNLGSTITAAEESFDVVTQIASNLGVAISDTEIEITKTFAQPFEAGGLLVLLQQPRYYHDWGGGAEKVISECATLDALNEAVLHCSGQDLFGKVSMLDLWAFVPPRWSDRLDEKELDLVKHQVLATIEAKKPDCILCMGDPAGNAVRTRLKDSSSAFWEDVCIVFAVHPSRSINHKSRNDDMRTKLFNQINEACFLVGIRSDNHLPQLDPDFDSLNKLAIMLLNCVFRPSLRLPKRNLSKHKTWFFIEEWHMLWFKHIVRSARSDPSPVNKARERLLESFNIMNLACLLDSWWLETRYVISWRTICDKLGGRLEAIEEDFQTILRGEEESRGAMTVNETHGNTETVQIDSLNFEDWRTYVVKRMDEIASRCLECWDKRYGNVKRRAKFIGTFADEDVDSNTSLSTELK